MIGGSILLMGSQASRTTIVGLLRGGWLMWVSTNIWRNFLRFLILLVGFEVRARQDKLVLMVRGERDAYRIGLGWFPILQDGAMPRQVLHRLMMIVLMSWIVFHGEQNCLDVWSRSIWRGLPAWSLRIFFNILIWDLRDVSLWKVRPRYFHVSTDSSTFCFQ